MPLFPFSGLMGIAAESTDSKPLEATARTVKLPVFAPELLLPVSVMRASVPVFPLLATRVLVLVTLPMDVPFQ